MAHLPLIQELLILQPRSNRGNLLRDAGFDVLRIATIVADIDAGMPLNFTLREVEDLLPAILRQTSIDDVTFAKLAAEAGIELSRGSAPDVVVVSIPFLSASGSQQLPITELASSSMVMWEISLRVKEVLEALGVREPLDPPGVTVTPGSTTFSFGGGTTLVSGIGLVIAAYAALPLGAAATIAYWGGSLVSLLGITDLIVSWRRSLAEVEKLTAETRKIEAEEQKILIEVERLTSDLRNTEAGSLLKAAHEKLVNLDRSRADSQPKPASALLPRQDIDIAANAYGIWPPLATHLINRVVPTIADATQNYPERITSSTGYSARAAGAA